LIKFLRTKKTEHKITTQEEHPMHIGSYTILTVTLLNVNCNKTHKSRLGYEIKYDLLKIGKHLKTLKPNHWTFADF